ncbi:Hypothetical protein PHPALM_12149 [Phytophthora palmivora]|uniref:Uncharacterized protein n=1 Tax=Phytophthora palmivora TaxID=4796 RepID=A0A2P4Y0P0_9STRA|nr:Hypothetical protein PHPALM_12149 [Phytophthora palmivora]
MVLRPGSSILKPGVRERQRELESVITKFELLLTIGRTKNPDFSSLDLAQIVFRLAEECRLCLIRLQRTAWQIDQSGKEPAQTHLDEDEDASATETTETLQKKLHDMLDETRRLYQLPEVAKSVFAVQGEVQVLLETGELLTFCKDHASAMTLYAEAIRLCSSIGDEATEMILTSKLRKLQCHADAMERVEVLATSSDDNDVESERNRLKAAFEKFRDANEFLAKDQLQSLAQELGMTDALTNKEVDEIWRQIQQNGMTGQSPVGINYSTSSTAKITFEALWRWWVSDSVYDTRSNSVF